MNRINLSQATFIIPIRIESSDRLRNVITTIAFLVENFDTNIMVKEVNSKSVFEEEAMPILDDIVEGTIWNNFNFTFEKTDKPLFHKTKILNEMIMEADTDIVISYDCDAILPKESYKIAYDDIINGKFDVVYPYGNGMYQKQVEATDEVVSNFLDKNDYSHLDSVSRIHTSDFGWMQFFKKQDYIDMGMHNENFKAYAPEDKEIYYRFKTLGYNIGRINDYVYHLEHSRGDNSWFSNPHMEDNQHEWIKLCNMNKEQLKEYYSNQNYLKKYNK